MFGHNVFSYDAIPSIYKSESVIFKADKVSNSAGYTDADYTTATNGQDLIGKGGKTNPVKWDDSLGLYTTDRGDGFKAIISNATDAVKFRKGYMTRYYRVQGENFVFESFSPTEPNVVFPFMTQEEYDQMYSVNNSNNDSGSSNGGSNETAVKGCMDETATNYDETATEDDGSCEYEEGSDSNLITFGIMGIVGIIAFSVLMPNKG